MSRTFVVQFENLNNQIGKLEKVFQLYDKNIKKENLQLINHDLMDQINLLKKFKQQFKTLIEEAVRKPTPAEDGSEFEQDIYGNNLDPKFNYRYAEISYSRYNKFSKVRLLGVSGISKIRFFIGDLEHDFEPSTILLLNNIRDIIEDPELLRQKELLSCKRNAWESDFENASDMANPEKKLETKYPWSEAIQKFLFPPGITEERGQDKTITEEQREQILKDININFADRDKMLERNRKIQQNKQAFLEKAREEKIEAISPSEKIEKILENSQEALLESGKKALDTLATATDKYSIGCLIKEAVRCVVPTNFNCADLFRNLSVTEIFDRLSIVFPRGTSTFRQLETLVEENVFSNIGTLEKEIQQLKAELEKTRNVLIDLEERNPNTNDKEILSMIEIANANVISLQQEVENKQIEYEEKREALFAELNFTERQKNISRQKGSLVAAFASPQTEQERNGAIAVADKIIGVIDSIVPLEDVCEAITNSLSLGGGSFPYIQFEGVDSIKFPKPREVNDIFANISVELNDVFVQGVAQSLIYFIQSFIDQLANCDNLDEFIARTLGSPPNEQNYLIYDELNNLFGPGTASEQTLNKFLNDSKGYFNSILDISFENEQQSIGASIGIDIESPAANPLSQITASVDTSSMGSARSIADFILSQGTEDPTSKWDISFDGEKFETSNGIRVIDIREVDNFANTITDELLSTLSTSGINGVDLIILKNFFKLRDGAEEDGETSEEPDPNSSEQEKQAATMNQVKQEFSSLLNSISSLLSPTETINLLAGNPSPNSLKVVKQLMNIKSPILSNAIGGSSQIKKMFSNFGESTGLGNLRDELRIIADSEISRNRDLPLNSCSPFSSVDDFRRALLENEISPETAENLIDKINAEKSNALKNMNNMLIDMLRGKTPTSAIDNYKEEAAKAIIEAITNNTVSPYEEKQGPEGLNLQEELEKKSKEMMENSEVYKDILNSAISSLFEPLKTTFDRDTKNYINTISTTREIEVEMKTFVDTEEGVVPTSEFRELINKGFGLSKQDGRWILDPTKAGKTAKKWADEISKEDPVKPLYKKQNAKIVADSFIQQFGNVDKNVSINLDEDRLTISLAGSHANTNVFETFSDVFNGSNEIFSSMRNSTPKWSIEYNEFNDSLKSFSAAGTGFIYTPLNGLESPFQNILFSSTDPIISEKDKAEVLEIFPGESLPTRSDAFYRFIDKELSFKNNKKWILKYYSYLFDFYFKLISEQIGKASLLKDISSGDSSLFGDSQKEAKIKLIELIDFVKQAPEEGLDPHILEFTELQNDFDKIYKKNKEAKKSEPTLKQLRGLEKRESPFAKSANLVLTKCFIRTCVVEFIFKTLFVADSFDFSTYFSELEIVNRAVVEFVLDQIKKRETADELTKNISLLYDYELENSNVEKVTEGEKRVSNIKLRKIVKKEFEYLYCKVSKIIGREQRVGLDSFTFIKQILNKVPTLDIHDFSREDENKYRELFKEQGREAKIVFEKFIRFSEITSTFQEFNQEAAGEDELIRLAQKEVTAGKIIEKFENLTSTTILYNCDNIEEGIYRKPPKFGVRAVLVVEGDTPAIPVPELIANFRAGEVQRPDFAFKDFEKKEKYVNTSGQTRTAIFYRFPIFEKTVDVSSGNVLWQDLKIKLEAGQATGLNEVFIPLKEELLETKEARTLFTYCFPIKEIITMLFLHSAYLHSDEKFSLLFESTKMLVDDFIDRMSNIGLKNNSSKSLDKIRKKQKQEEDNVGNPLGPLDPDALKFFIRTPIQITKSMAVMSDPNLAIADKIVGATSMAAALAGQKFSIPYSVASLALLPFPVFTGPPPIGIAPPLTAYNLTFPIAPTFLALEPLLFDLPWFQDQNKGDESNKKAAENSSNEIPDSIEESCKTDEENNN